MGQGSNQYVKITSFRTKTTQKLTESKMMKKSLISNMWTEPLDPAHPEIITTFGLLNYLSQ